jgi:hypothetical protein
VEALEDRLVPTFNFNLGATGVSAASSLLAHETPYIQRIGTTPVNPVSLLAQTPGTPQWFNANLGDPGINSVAQTDYARDGALTRGDMLDLFRQAEADGVVSAAELHDLQTLVTNGPALGMPDDVHYLADKVVNGSPANSTYQPLATFNFGGFLQGRFSTVAYNLVDVAPLGNLAAGGSATQLADLVDKWFYGNDLPTNNDFAGSGWDFNSPYAYANGSLFGNGSYYYDIGGGNSPDLDSDLLAGLGALAKSDPAAVTRLFHDNGDGTFSVRFFDNHGAPVYVTVNRWLPEDVYGSFEHAGPGGWAVTNPTNQLWVALAEKAYAQANHQGLFGNADTANSYAALANGDPAATLRHLTGLNVWQQEMDESNLYLALQNNYLVIVHSWADTTDNTDTDFTSYDDGSEPVQIPANRNMVVVGYDAVTDQYEIDEGNQDVAVPSDFMADLFDNYVVGSNPGDPSTAGAPPQAQDGEVIVDQSVPLGGLVQNVGAQFAPTGVTLLEAQPLAMNADIVQASNPVFVAASGTATVTGDGVFVSTDGGLLTIVVDDSTDAVGHTYDLQAGSLSRDGTVIVTFSGAGSLALHGGQGNNTFLVERTTAGFTTDIYGGQGTNTFVVHDNQAGTLDGIQGPLNLHGGPNGAQTDTATLDDSANPVGQSFDVTATAVTRSGTATIRFDQVSAVTLYTSSQAANAVTVESVAAGVALNLKVEDGDTVIVGQPLGDGTSTLANIQGTVTVQSLGGTQTVVVDNSADTQPHDVSLATTAVGVSLEGLAPATLYLDVDPASLVQVNPGAGDVTGLDAFYALLGQGALDQA